MLEKEYIEREALQNKAFGEDHPTFYDGQDIADWYEKCINETPAADVAEVVRCKDCDNFEDIICGWCRYFEQPITLNDYCSRGERIDSDNG